MAIDAMQFETREDEALRDRITRDIESGNPELVEVLGGNLPDEFAWELIASVACAEGLSVIWKLLARASNERLSETFREALDEIIEEEMQNARDRG